MIKCPLPWTGIAVNPDGSVRNCAVSRDVLGNLQSADIVDILNSTTNDTIKASLTAGVWPKNCGHCERVETVDPEFSNRTFQLHLHRNASPTARLTQLDLRWSNTCNYACIYCSPELSSTWAAELKRSKINTERDNLKSLREYAYSNLDDLVEVYLAGGEPLMIKENSEFLDQLFERNPNCLVRITTNLSNLTTGIYTKIKQFPNVQWEVSVEATGEHFEYIRYPGNWVEFETNLRQLIAEWPRERIGLTMNYLLLNSDTIIETGDRLINMGIDINRTAVHYLTHPTFLDARNLGEKYIAETHNYLNSYHTPDTTFGTSLRNCAEFLTKPFDKNPDNVVKYLNKIDKRRNLNFTATFPNILNKLI